METRLESRSRTRHELGATSHALHEQADQVQADPRTLRTLTTKEQRTELFGVAAESLARIGKGDHEL
jgi:hypothetical protein